MSETPPIGHNAMICPTCLQFVDGVAYLADETSCSIAVIGKTVRMKRQQFRLASYMLGRAPLMATRDQIYHAVFENARGDGPDPKIIDIIISQIRPVLVDLGFGIQTVWGRGYQIVRASPDEARKINTTFIGGRRAHV
jgi:DNA-binding response OmpR family regulator